MSDADQPDTQGKDRSGAESLVQTFVDAGVNVCFANPGTSEMHFVAALDSKPEMRCVLGLFEGVVTGAADGYGQRGLGKTDGSSTLEIGCATACGVYLFIGSAGGFLGLFQGGHFGIGCHARRPGWPRGCGHFGGLVFNRT